MVVRATAFGARTRSAILSLSLLLLAGAAAHAQAPLQSPAASSPPPPQAASAPKPVTGFVTSYEIMRTVRSAGFEPLAPPLREGTTYVLRATDFRGILMRVVLDARTGVIRDVTRIVSDASGPYGVVAPAYGSSATYDAPAVEMRSGEEGAAPQSTRPAAEQAAEEPGSSTHTFVPPLPQPRPRALAARRPQRRRIGAANGAARRNTSANAQPPAARIGVNAGAAAAPSTAQGKTSPVAPPIND
jgi:hypothetical protein